MPIHRVKLFVEGQGDEDAAPILVKKIVKDVNLTEVLAIESDPFRLGGIEKITGKNKVQWTNKLRAATKQPGVEAILMILDGDSDKCEGSPFCASSVAKTLVERAIPFGAGKTFSLACVFACLEYETWLLAGAESLAGKVYRDDLIGVRADTKRIDGDLEKAPRGAKRALGKLMHSGTYKESLDQEHLTKLVSTAVIRSRGLRSFRRLEHAITQLGEALRNGKHISSPAIEE